MNDVPLDTRDADAADGGEGWDELATLPLAEVRELFVTLGKALRAYQLYDQNNPVYKRFVSSLGEAFTKLWAEVDRLTVHVSEEALTLGPTEVYRSDTRSDSLAFLFYKDGIRELTFLPGIEEDELTRFLSVLQRARQARQEGDDLLTILWEEDLRNLRYQYVDLLAEGVEIPEPGEGHDQAELQGVLQGELGEPGAEEEAGPEAAAGGPPPSQDGPQTVSKEDFNPTLYSLDAREMEKLQQEIRVEMERDLRGDVLAALFDRLEEPGHPERQEEILGIFQQLLPSFLSRGVLDASTDVLRELRRLEEGEGELDEARRAEAGRVIDELSAPETLDELVRALEDGSIEADPAELGAFLTQLRSAALGPLLRAMELTEVKELRPVLAEAVGGMAKRNPGALSELLRSDDPVVLAGAARLVGHMGLTEAGPALAELMGHAQPEVRLAAVRAAAELRASTAAGALQGVLTDPDREVRIAAARALGDLEYRPAARHFESIVGGKDIRGADLSEKIAFFEAFGQLAGDAAVGPLDKLLNGRGFLGRREPPEIRACAALGLGKVGTAEAQGALQDATDEEDPVIRSAVNRALRGDEGEDR